MNAMSISPEVHETPNLNGETRDTSKPQVTQ